MDVAVDYPYSLLELQHGFGALAGPLGNAGE
jgi:hypothetical protein